MKYDTLKEIVEKRRSIHVFQETEIAREEIEKIIKIGTMAPSGFNSQPWEIFVVDDEDKRGKIAGYIFELMGDKYPEGFADAPVFILMYGDVRVRDRGPAMKKDDDEWWNHTFKTSLANAFMSMQLAAASLDLGTMWVSPVKAPPVEKKIRELLQVPDYFELFEMMALGLPEEDPFPRQLRSVSEVTHYNGI